MVSRNTEGLIWAKFAYCCIDFVASMESDHWRGNLGGGSNGGACATIHSNISLTCFITYATSSLQPPVSFPPLLHSIPIGVVGPDIEREGPTRAKSSDNSINIHVVSLDFIDYFFLVGALLPAGIYRYEAYARQASSFHGPFRLPTRGRNILLLLQYIRTFAQFSFMPHSARRD